MEQSTLAEVANERPWTSQRIARNDFAKWIDFSTECTTFDNADYGNFHRNPSTLSWIDSNGNMWGFLQGYADVGTNREQFGYFENPNNYDILWLGFPVISFSQSS